MINACKHCGSPTTDLPKEKTKDFREQAVFILDAIESGSYQFQELIRELEDAAIDLAMEEEKGIVAKAARKINMNRQTLNMRLSARRKSQWENRSSTQ